MDKQRTAQEIRAYCEAAKRGESGLLWKRLEGGGWSGGLRPDFATLARVDMPRLLDEIERYRDAAVKLRRLFYGIDTWQDKERILAETAWLAETPEEAKP